MSSTTKSNTHHPADAQNEEHTITPRNSSSGPATHPCRSSRTCSCHSRPHPNSHSNVQYIQHTYQHRPEQRDPFEPSAGSGEQWAVSVLAAFASSQK